jgi:flavorubredoxin
VLSFDDAPAAGFVGRAIGIARLRWQDRYDAICNRSGCRMETRCDEIADGVFRLSTCVPEVAPPAGFTFNQFLILADQPLLFHCGPRGMFPMVSAAVARLLPLEELRWISFGHVEADECGAMNHWLAAAPEARVVFNPLGCDVSLNDLADRVPLALGEDQVLDLGGKRVRLLPTPHVPHTWEAQVLFEETGATLFCGDLFTHFGDTVAVTEGDVVEPAMQAEEMFRYSSLGPATVPTMRSLADLEPSLLALMHGASFRGDGAGALRALADRYEARLQTVESVP